MCLRLCVVTLLLLAGGCGIGSERKDPQVLKAERLRQEKAELTGDVQQYRAEIEQLKTQVRALSALPEDERSNPYELVTVKIARITNFYDKDSDGKREKLIVYVEPMDMDGDVVKAAGTVAVQLWNLNNPNGEALLGQWNVEWPALRKLWFASIVTGYRLTFDVPETIDVLSEPLTVKLTFTESLTGETLRDQRLIDPKLD